MAVVDVPGVSAVDHGDEDVEEKEGRRDGENDEGGQGEEGHVRVEVLLGIKAVHGDGEHGVDGLGERQEACRLSVTLEEEAEG